MISFYLINHCHICDMSHFFFTPDPADFCLSVSVRCSFTLCLSFNLFLNLKNFLATPLGTWDLSSLTGDQTWVPGSGSSDS